MAEPTELIAQIIRVADGCHVLGAGALAEAIVDELPLHGLSIVPEGHARIDGEVVRITHARNHKNDYEGAYIAGTFCGWIDDKADTYGRCADGFYKPLYVVEAPDAR